MGVQQTIESFMPNWFEQVFQPLLEETNTEKTAVRIWKKIFWQSVLLATILWIALLLQNSGFYIILGGVAGLLAPLGFWYFFFLLKAEHYKRKKELAVPDLLLSCSAFPKGTDTLSLLQFGASKNFGLLGKEFEKACKEIQNGACIEQALRNMKKRCKSRVINRMTDLLVMGYESGADLSLVFRETAEDLYKTRFLLQERQATLLVEKYTILVAGGIIVPVILGLVTGLMHQLDFSALNLLEIGLDAAQRKALLAATVLGSMLYLVEYSLLAAFFVAHQEGNWKKGMLYAAILFPLSWLGFWLAKGG